MEKKLLLVALLTLSLSDLFAQGINSLSVSPQNPTVADEVMLHINGERWSSDMNIASISVNQTGNSFTVDIDFQGVGIGLPVVIPFDTVVSLGYLSAGNYDATVNGLSYGQQMTTQSTTFTVSISTGQQRLKPTTFDMVCAPNPFVRETMVRLSLPVAGATIVSLFDILGQQVATVFDGPLNAGNHELKFEGSFLPAGRYYLHLMQNGRTSIKQVMKRN